jgi:hypothetical protein
MHYADPGLHTEAVVDGCVVAFDLYGWGPAVLPSINRYSGCARRIRAQGWTLGEGAKRSKDAPEHEDQNLLQSMVCSFFPPWVEWHTKVLDVMLMIILIGMVDYQERLVI